MVRNALMPWTREGIGLGDNMDRLLSGALDRPLWSGNAELEELDDRVVLRFDVPGVKPDKINVTAENRMLTVEAEREGRGNRTWRYTIDSSYDLGKIEAKLEDGVLTLSLPKAAEAQPRRIPVTSVGSKSSE